MPTDKPVNSDLEKQYQDIFKVEDVVPKPDEQSLEQPWPFPIIQTVSTNGAYADPIVGPND